jgi:arsenite methyltransferase
VIDLGSGSGMDTFCAHLQAGDTGHVHGIDMTDEQREKAERLRGAAGFQSMTYHKAYIEDLRFADASADVVISNGVINLSADKGQVFREAARVLRPGGRLAISDIVTEKQLPEGVTCDATLWAACIGGAMQQDSYRGAITTAGFRIVELRENPNYLFLSESAQGASRTYGVKSISLLALRE